MAKAMPLASQIPKQMKAPTVKSAQIADDDGSDLEDLIQYVESVGFADTAAKKQTVEQHYQKYIITHACQFSLIANCFLECF